MTQKYKYAVRIIVLSIILYRNYKNIIIKTCNKSLNKIMLFKQLQRTLNEVAINGTFICEFKLKN